MANYKVTDAQLTAIADKIRNKGVADGIGTGSKNLLNPSTRKAAVESGKTYVLSAHVLWNGTDSIWLSMVTYDENNNLIGFTSADTFPLPASGAETDEEFTFTAGNGVAKISVSFTSGLTVTNVQLEEGSSATSYVPFKSLEFPDDFEDAIEAISTLAADTADANATAADILSGKTAYVKGEQVTGEYTLAAHTQGTAAAGDIKSGKTAYVNGAEVTGTYDPMAELSVKQKTFTFEFVATSSISVNKGGYVFLNGTCEELDTSGLVIDDDLTMNTIGTVETNISTTYFQINCNGLIKSDGEIKARFYVRNTFSQGAMSITSGKYIKVPVTMYVSTYTDEPEGQNNG